MEMKKIRLPTIKLDHLKSLTDDTGILQHAKYSIANRKLNYTTDDNARALVTCLKYLQLHKDPNINRLAKTYLSFLYYMQRPDGRLHNELSYYRAFLDDVGSEDCMGRTLWACGYALKTEISNEFTNLSKEIFDRTFQHAMSFSSIRSKAFTILGLCNYYQAFPQDQNCLKNLALLSKQLLEFYEKESSPDWNWFEPYLTYCNARLSQALFKAYSIIRDKKYLNVANESFNFLTKTQMIDKRFVPVGNNGWYKKGGQRANYDQQPIEASCMIETALTSYQLAGNENHHRLAYKIFEWFLGQNTKNVEVYNSNTGACHDGVTTQGLNLNQGAESTVSYLSARADLELDFTH
jgi:uncharacterized protein YyaL (SSP411 family)